jgi:hypothetical protein
VEKHVVKEISMCQPGIACGNAVNDRKFQNNLLQNCTFGCKAGCIGGNEQYSHPFQKRLDSFQSMMKTPRVHRNQSAPSKQGL